MVLLTVVSYVGLAGVAPRSEALEPVAADRAGIERRSVDPVVEGRDGRGDGERPEGPTLRDKVILARRLGAGGAIARRSGRRTPGAITTTYERATPTAVRDVVDAAIAAWDEALDLSAGAPVEISVLWTDLGSRLLGQAGTEGEYRDPDQFPTDRWYPAALANHIADFDINGASTPEIMIELNSGLGEDWYIGVEGRPGFGQVDLYSVVLHEVGHGLGFLGSATADRSGRVSVDHEPPSIYDDLVELPDGRPLTSIPRTDAVAALTSDDLVIDIGFGRTMPLSAPAPFVNGSSYSHFDEAAVGPSEPGSLMTPALRNGEVQRDLDAAVLGVLDHLGWDLAVPLLRPDLEQVAVGPGEVEVAWSEDWSRLRSFPAEYVARVDATVSSDRLPAPRSITVAADQALEARLASLQNGTTYRLTVTGQREDRAAGGAAETTVLLPPDPNPVRDLRVRPNLPVVVAWEQPPESGEPVSRYEVQHRRASDRTWTATGQTSGRSLSVDLPAGRYWFRVRAVNPVGPGAWTETALTGVSASGIRPMPLDGQLARLYQAYFGRAPDPPGMEYWLDVRSSGGSLTTVSESFARSPEFLATYGPLSDAEFVDRVYRNVLDRPADQGGFDYWLGRLQAGASRGGVMLGFAESTEYVRATGTVPAQSSIEGAVERLHLAAFRRAPDGAELQRWVRRARSASLVALGELMLADPEFTSTRGDLDDSQFIDVMYDQVVGRPADDTGRRYWLDRLRGGTSRGAVLNGFAQSSEFIVVTGTGV